MKMTKISKANLAVADKAVIVPVDGSDQFMVQLYRGSMSSFVSSSKGPVEYASLEAAARAVRRVRGDLEPTTI